MVKKEFGGNVTAAAIAVVVFTATMIISVAYIAVLRSESVAD